MTNSFFHRYLIVLSLVSVLLVGAVLLSPLATAESGDTSGPVVQDFELSSDSFEAGETMEIEVDAADKSDIARLYFRYEHTDGGGAVYDAYRDFEPAVESGTYTIEYQWPEDTPAGTYEISYVSAEDSIGNRRTYHDDIPGKEQVTIESDLTDTEGPTVESFELSGDSFEAGETMEIDVTATDATGIARLYFRYEHTDGGGAVYDAYRDFEPAVEDGTYTIEYQWPEDTAEGTYEISYVSAEDSIENRRTYHDDIPGKEQVVIGSSSQPSDEESVQENEESGIETEQEEDEVSNTEAEQENITGQESRENDEAADSEPVQENEDTSRSVVDAILDALSDLFTASTLNY